MAITYDNAPVVRMIPVGAIKPNPYQTRKFMDVTSVSDLADSIKEFGLIEPLILRRLKAGVYELAVGERRLRAAEMAGLSEVPCIVLDISETDSAVITVAVNIQRKSIDFFEEADAYKTLSKEHGLSVENISALTGVRPSVITIKLKLADFSSTVKNIIRENKLSEQHAKALINLKDDDMRLQLLKKIIEKEYDAKETEKYISDELKHVVKKKRVVRKRPKGGASDYIIVLNTLNKALDLVKNAGVTAKTVSKEHDKYYEYVIRINK